MSIIVAVLMKVVVKCSGVSGGPSDEYVAKMGDQGGAGRAGRGAG